MHTECVRCGRPLRSERAKATGYGEHCRRGVYRAALVLYRSGNPQAVKAAIGLYNANISLLKSGRVWRIMSNTSRRVYMAAPNTCNCEGAQYRPVANSCYHSIIAAVLAA